MKSALAMLAMIGAWALLSFSAFAAPPPISGTPGVYTPPNGGSAIAGVVHVVGIDSSTGKDCLIGSVSTCQLPGTNGGGGGGAIFGQNGTTAMSATNPLAVVPGSSGFGISNTGFNALQGGAANSTSNPFYMAPSSGAVFGSSALANAYADGWDVTMGFKADGPCSSPTASCSLEARVADLEVQEAAIKLAAQAALAAGTNSIGNLNPASNVGSTALETAHVIKASAGNLYSFEVSADTTLSGAAWWVMIFNATSAPADGAVTPAKCYSMSSGQTGYAGAFAAGGVAFSTGIVIAVSTTGCFTKTSSAHAQISGDYL